MIRFLFALLAVIVWSVSLADTSEATLVTHLEFEGNTVDSTGNIAYTSTPGAYVSGPTGFGQAMSFEKANSNVVYAEGVGGAMASVTSEVTIALWAYGSSLLPSTGDPTVLFSANDDQAEIGAQWSRISLQYPYDSANDYVFYDTWDESGAFDRAYKYAGDNQFYKDGWHHIAFVKNTTASDASATDARMKIYVDGNLWMNTFENPYGGGDGTGLLSDIDNIYLGAEKQYWNYWDGLIDDFRIYDSELSQAEIQALMTTVPEPTSLAFMVMSCVSLLGIHRHIV
ncbi:LamG domain-containing protein [Bythopirellula polymerisocia]|nr:LamG domain-containing protein [Bythopirellula polymerisocia]